MTNTNKQIYREITTRILKDLEQGLAPWVKPWRVEMPYNLITTKEYSGINVLLLWQLTELKGYKQSAWLTFRQVKELGGTIKKGEKAAKIIYTSVVENTDEDKKDYFFIKNYAVFNLEQTTGLDQSLFKSFANNEAGEKLEKAENFLESLPALVKHGGSRAYYHNHPDESKTYIQIPEKTNFKSLAYYYATLLHEYGHWTGHSSRLNRIMSSNKYSPAYMKEELVAELTAAFLSAHLGIKAKLQHSEYIQSWIKLLNEDNRIIIQAASRASKAAEYLKALAD